MGAQRDGKLFAIKTHKNLNNYAGDQIRYRLMNEIIMLASGVILGKSECPYVIKLKDWYEKNEQFGLIMDYHQTDLHQVLSKCSFTEEEAAFFLAEIVLAIEAVHSAGVIHNDIKPENILIDQSGHAILTDFGIAEIGADKKYGRYGTPVYMSPESLKICGHDRQADWWSFGVMMYEMLAGYLPFEGRSSADLIRSQRKKLHFPGHMSKDAVDLLQRILNRNPHKRLSASVDKVKAHPFFAAIDWKKTRTRRARIAPRPNGRHFARRPLDFGRQTEAARGRVNVCANEALLQGEKALRPIGARLAPTPKVQTATEPLFAAFARAAIFDWKLDQSKKWMQRLIPLYKKRC